MAGRGRRGGLSRWLLDFALAFALFWAAAVLAGTSRTHAHAVPLPPAATAPNAARSETPAPAAFYTQHARVSAHAGYRAQALPEHALLFFSLAVAALAAVNIGFYRHLRRVYASPRRSVWRRG